MEKINDKIKVKRNPKRGIYDEATIHEILDKEYVCQVGFVFDGYPVIIPMLYGREGNKIYLHGATTSRMMTKLEKGEPICLSVTRLNGLVLARSVFHHSANYESVVLFGKGKSLQTDEEKMHALEVVSDHILKGRWNEARLPNSKELKATKVIEFEIEQASAKRRTGGPKDDKEDYSLNVWAGVLPYRTIVESPIPDPDRIKDEELPKSFKNMIGS